MSHKYKKIIVVVLWNEKWCVSLLEWKRWWAEFSRANYVGWNCQPSNVFYDFLIIYFHTKYKFVGSNIDCIL